MICEHSAAILAAGKTVQNSKILQHGVRFLLERNPMFLAVFGAADKERKWFTILFAYRIILLFISTVHEQSSPERLACKLLTHRRNEVSGWNVLTSS